MTQWFQVAYCGISHESLVFSGIKHEPLASEASVHVKKIVLFKSELGSGGSFAPRSHLGSLLGTEFSCCRKANSRCETL